MANKTLEAARKAYNRNQQTKGGQRKAKKDRIKTKKKKQKPVSSSWDSVREKTQTAGKKGENNRKSSISQTKKTVNKAANVAKSNQERAKSKTGKATPLKSTTGAGNSHRGFASSANVTNTVTQRRKGIEESKRAREVAGDVIRYAGKDVVATATSFLKNGGKNTANDPDYKGFGQSLKNAADGKKTGSYKPVKTAPKGASVNQRTGTWETKSDWKKMSKIAGKAVASAEKEIQDATKNISDKKNIEVGDYGFINNLIGMQSTKDAKAEARKSIEGELKKNKLTLTDAVKEISELSSYGDQQGWTDDTMLTNGMTWGELKKSAGKDILRNYYGARRAAYEGFGEVGKVSKRDLAQMGIKGGVAMAEILAPYIGTAGKFLKGVDALSTGGKALTAVEGGSRVLTKAGETAVKNAVKASGGNTLKGISDAAKAVAKSDLKTNVKREIIANALQDATIGTGMDYMATQKQGLTGKDAWKYMGESAIMNAVLGTPIAGIAGRTGKAGKAAINQGITESANAAITLSKAEGIELGTLLKKAENGIIMGREQERLLELQQKAFGSEHYVVNSKGKIVQNNADTTIEALSREDAKQYLNLQAKQASGTLRPDEIGQFVQLQRKVQKAYKQTETVSEKIINLNSGAIKARDLGDAETAVRFYERTGDEAKLKVAQKALEAARVATKNLNESLDKAMKIMTEKTGIEYKWVTADEMRAMGASEESIVKGFTDFDENGKATVYINRESPQAYQAVIGHETMHLIKKSNPQAYKELADSLEKYVKEIGEYDELETFMRRNYPELQGNDPKNMADFREEMVSEMLGRYVFGEDDKFIKRLAGENPTALEKMVDYIKNLVKKVKNPELADQFNAFVKSAKDAIEAINKDEVAKNAKGEYNSATEVAENGRRVKDTSTREDSGGLSSEQGDISRGDVNNANGDKREIADRLADKYAGSLPRANSGKGSLPKRSNVKLSKGYHAGDLGKSESLGQQSGGRSTGHFGTGTYFVGNKEKLSGFSYKDRPIEEVEFDNYNLYRPKSTDEALELHDNLAFIDEYYKYANSPYTDPDVIANVRSMVDEIDNRYQDLDGIDYDHNTWELIVSPSAQKEMNKLGDELKNLMVKYDGEPEYKSITGYDDFDGNYTDRQLGEMMDYFRDYGAGSWSRAVEDVVYNLKKMDKVAEFFGMTRDDLFAELKRIDDETKNIPYADRFTEDSAATRFMKKLGYEGVDVRHTDLDNTTFGSVIYDLKGEDLDRKQEIRTARFSKEAKQKFVKQIDAWDGKTIGFSFTLGDTSKTLQMAGLGQKQVRLDASKLLSAMNKHDSGLSKNVVKQIPDLLEDPVIIVQSKKFDSRVLVLGDLYDENKKPVTTVLELMPTSKSGTTLDVIKVASVEGRGHIQSVLPTDKLIYINPNIEKTDNWLNVNRVQFPLRSTDYGLIRKVTYQDGNVKLVDVPKNKDEASKEKPAEAGSFNEEIKNLDPDYVKNIGTGAKFSKVAKPETLKFLDDQEKAGKTVEVYRAMVEIDGKLYPPMATKIKSGSGKAELQDANKLGEWVQADEHPELLDKDGKFVLRKDNGTTVPAAYNPYIHTSFSPLNDQFTSAYKRPNLVVVKGIVPESELTSGYKATGAKDAVGKTQWHSGVVAGQLPEAREVMLTRWFKPQEVVSDAEVAKTIKQTLGDTGIEIPYNVVTPSLRRELEKIGVPIGEGRGGAPKEIPSLESGKARKKEIGTARFSKEARGKRDTTLDAEIKTLLKDEHLNSGAGKAFEKDLREVAKLVDEDKIDEAVTRVQEVVRKHMTVDEYEAVGDVIDDNVKSIIKSSPINISGLGDGTIAHKLENIGLSKADVPSAIQLRSVKGGRPLDRVYTELSDDRPDIFPPDASSEDKLKYIIESLTKEPDRVRKPQDWIDGEYNDLAVSVLEKVADGVYADRKLAKPKVETPKAEPKAEKPKAEKPKKPAKPKEPEKTEVQKLHENEYVSDNVKTALKDIEEAGVNVEKAEKIAKRFNNLDKQIGAKTKHIENAKKSEKYATEAERAERVAELEDELATLKQKQAKAAGELEQLGKMKAVDPDKTAEQQIKEMRGERKVNKELKNTENLTKTDNWIKDKWNSVRRLWEDSLIDVENTAKATGDMNLRNEILTAANRVRNSMSEANTWITKHRRSFDNKVGGKSLDEIFSKELINNEPKYADYQEYLIMKHVPARHDKGTDIYPEISPALAEKRVKELEEKYRNKEHLKEADELEARLGEMTPEERVEAKKKIKELRKSEIETWADDVYDYINDLQQYRVDSGMLSQEAADQFAKDYPFYVPTNRVNDESGQIDFFTGGLSNGIRSAKGGDNDVLDMYSQLYTATNKTIHAAEENQMLNLYFRAKGVTKEQLEDATLDDLEHAVIEAKVNKKTGASTVTFFVDGTPVKLPCNHQLALGLREMDGLEFERLLKAAKVATLYGKPFKALVTDWNLAFGVRNGARDLQQALVNSKDTRFFASSTGAALHAVSHEDSPYRKLYASMGGEQAQLVSYDAVAKQMGIERQGKVDAIHEKVQDIVDLQVKGKYVNPIHYVEAVNGAIEMTPRMCEFIGTLRKEADRLLKKDGSSLKKLRKEIIDQVKADEKAGKLGETEISAVVEDRLAEKIIDMVGKDTIDTAMRNANDITLNFGRSGVLGKALNMGFVPYLNPSIQGLSKLVRLFTEAGQEGGWKALASIGMKLGTFTIAPAVLNEVLLKDNEDYQNLNTRDKDNAFFIPLDKFGEEWEGKFFKFPKPRENAVLAEPVEYGLRYFLDNTEYDYFDWDKLKMEGVPLWEKIPLTDEGKQSFRTALDNIGVINPATSNMLSPIWQTFHNKTWYGGNIESAYETSINEDENSDRYGKANVPVNKRYDTGTSAIAIQLGQTKVAKELNLSPKKIDNLLDSYTGMIYDLGISQFTEEAKTRGNWFNRTLASQFVKDSVFSNKLSTKAWEKMDGMTKKEQDEYKSKYMYDTYKYDDAQDLITGDKKLSAKEKMDAKRALQIKKNKLNRAAINGDPNETTPLKDIAEFLGATKTLNHFLPDTGGKDSDTWVDYFKNYKKTKGYKGLTPAQKEKQSQKFLDVYNLGVKGQSKIGGDFHDSPSWGMTGVAAAQRYKQGKLSQKDAETIMQSCGVYESQTASYFKYADHGGNVSRYAVTKKNNKKAESLAEELGVPPQEQGSIWRNKYSSEKGIAGGALSMSLATGKADFKDRAYYISNSGDANMLIKMNAARGYAEKYGHTTKQLIKLGKKADKDGNTYLSNDEIQEACMTIKGGKATDEERAMGWVLLGGNPNKNPFGEIGNYAHDGDTGITMDDEEKSGGGGHGWGRRGRRRGRRGRGGGGSGSGGASFTPAVSKATKVTNPNNVDYSFTKAKVTNPFGSSNTSRKSNLDEAYRKRVRKLRGQMNKK